MISPLNPVTAIAPLVFVIALSMLREGLEDYARHKSDRLMNSSQSSIIDPAGPSHQRVILKQWASIQVGDLIVLKENEPIPADCLLLGSNLPTGMCYIQTSSLDGEKALKPKQCINQTQDLFSSIESIPSPQMLEDIVFVA